MTARANWHLNIEVPDDDPFANVSGKREPPDLYVRLAYLVRSEGRLDAQGVTCPIRNAEGTCCHACPVNHQFDSDHRLQHLCKVGTEIEKVITTLEAGKHAVATDRVQVETNVDPFGDDPGANAGLGRSEGGAQD